MSEELDVIVARLSTEVIAHIKTDEERLRVSEDWRNATTVTLAEMRTNFASGMDKIESRMAGSLTRIHTKIEEAEKAAKGMQIKVAVGIILILTGALGWFIAQGGLLVVAK